MKRNILVVASHPDDEILGCAGTIARHVNEGDCVHIHIVAEGATSRSVESKGAAKSEKGGTVIHGATGGLSAKQVGNRRQG